MDKNKCICFLIRREEFLILYMYMYYHACVLVIRFDSWSINHILKCILCIPPLFLFATCLLCKLLGPPYLDQFLVVANETVREKKLERQFKCPPVCNNIKMRERERVCVENSQRKVKILSRKKVFKYMDTVFNTYNIGFINNRYSFT